MVKIPLCGGKTALVDASDLDLVSDRRWRTWKPNSGTTIYAISGSGNDKELMHRLLMEFPQGRQVDHVNGNGLDNRRRNLRLANHQEQQQNRTAHGWGRSAYKGVSFHKPSGLWLARCGVGGVVQSQYRHTEDDAARAYDAMARKAFGKFARLNFPEEG